MFTSLDADGNEAEIGIARALGMSLTDWRQFAVYTISDWVAESMQEIVGKLNKAERRFIPIPSIHTDDQEC